MIAWRKPANQRCSDKRFIPQTITLCKMIEGKVGSYNFFSGSQRTNVTESDLLSEKRVLLNRIGMFTIFKKVCNDS